MDWKPSKPSPEQRVQLEQKPRSRWQSIKNQVVRAAKVAEGSLTMVLDLVAFLSFIILIWLLWRDVIRGPVTSALGLRVVLTGVGILLIIRIGYHYEWTGFGERAREKSEAGESQPRKTLWDWMTLLLVPIMIAGVAPWFTWWQNNSERALEAQQRAQEAQDQAQSAALQAYLGQMSQLIKEDGLRVSAEGDVVFTLAQARTTTTIRQLNGARNQIVIRFLSDSGLLRQPPLLAGVGLEDAELPKAELQEANLVRTELDVANLSEAVLIRTDLSGASLQDANLSHAALQDADLSAESTFNLQDAPLWVLKKEATNLTDANLSHAALQHANLSSAILQNADLTNADLTNANLTDAYLRDANLTDARGWTMEQLTAARSLKGATMPNGQKYEDWLKDREPKVG